MNKVQTGQQLKIKATTWNSFIDAAEYVKNVQSNQNGSIISGGIHNGIVLVQNGEENTIPQSSALVLVDLLSVPSDKQKNRYSMPVFLGKTATEETQQMPYGITLSPIAPSKIGRVMLLGIIQANVTIQNETDSYATPIPDDKTGALQSSSSGAVRILWKKGTTGEQPCMLQLGGAGGGNKYDGPLAIITDTANPSSLMIVDGAYPERGTAGHIYCNGIRHSVKRQQITAEPGILYISCSANERAEPQLAFNAPFQHFPNTDDVSALAYYPIAEIEEKKLPDSTESKFFIRQLVQYTYPELWIAGPCDTNEQAKK